MIEQLHIRKQKHEEDYAILCKNYREAVINVREGNPYEGILQLKKEELLKIDQQLDAA